MNYFDVISQHLKIVDFEVIHNHQCFCILCFNSTFCPKAGLGL